MLYPLMIVIRRWGLLYFFKCFFVSLVKESDGEFPFVSFGSKLGNATDFVHSIREFVESEVHNFNGLVAFEFEKIAVGPDLDIDSQEEAIRESYGQHLQTLIIANVLHILQTLVAKTRVDLVCGDRDKFLLRVGVVQ